MVFIQIVSIGSVIAIGYFCFKILRNIVFLCKTIKNYYTSVEQMNEYKVDDLCSDMATKYYIMLACFIIVILVRLLGNWLGFRAYGVLRKKFEE